MDAVLLAAGRGRRLAPWTERTPKCLLQVNETAVIDYTLRSLQHAEVRRVHIVTGHLGGQVREYLGSKWGGAFRLRFVDQQPLTGTASALAAASGSLFSSGIARDEPVIVAATDYVMEIGTIKALVDAYVKLSPEIVLSLRRLPRQARGKSSVVKLRGGGKVTRLIEKPRGLQLFRRLSASLIYIVPLRVVEFCAHAPLSPRGEYELPAVIDRMLRDGYTARGVIQNDIVDVDSCLRRFAVS